MENLGTAHTRTVSIPSPETLVLVVTGYLSLGRIKVETLGDTTLVSAHNVYYLSFNTSQITTSEVIIDGLHVPIASSSLPETIYLHLDSERRWKVKPPFISYYLALLIRRRSRKGSKTILSISASLQVEYSES